MLFELSQNVVTLRMENYCTTFSSFNFSVVDDTTALGVPGDIQTKS